MKRIFSIVLVTFLLLLVFTATISAQDYSIAVPEVEVWVFIESDGTLTIEYYYLFEVPPGAEPLDVVQLGMPADSTYTLDDISGTIDDMPIAGVSYSNYVDGVDIVLGSHTIPSGGSGVLYIQVNNVGNVFYSAESEDERDYASLQFMPNYYSSELSRGNTEFTFSIILPPGAKDGEVVWYSPKGWPGDESPS